jgi:DNA-binding NarL/FixJ family response regulator
MRILIADDKPDLISDLRNFLEGTAQMDADPLATEFIIEAAESVEQLREQILAALDSRDLLPDLIFLDLAFEERADGIEALKFLKYHKDRDVRNVPVIMYSQSDHPRDIYVTISFRANAYMTKDGGLERLWNSLKHWRNTQLVPHVQPPDLDDVLEEPHGPKRRSGRQPAGRTAVRADTRR